VARRKAGSLSYPQERVIEVEIAVLLLFENDSGEATGSRARDRGWTARRRWLAGKGTPVHDDLVPCGIVGPRRGKENREGESRAALPHRVAKKKMARADPAWQGAATMPRASASTRGD
jgi:hypothetical protein